MPKKIKTIITGPLINARGSLARHNIVRLVVNTFIKTEYRRKGRGVAFRYPVEHLPRGQMLYIARPGHKKNFDFKVNVENQGFGDGSHIEIARDLRKKKKENARKFEYLLKAITEIYTSQENNVDILLKKYRGIKNSFHTGGKVEPLLKIVKWLFIMEDIVYWDNEGRAFLFNFLRYVAKEDNNNRLKEALNKIKNPDRLKSFMNKSGIDWIPCK